MVDKKIDSSEKLQDKYIGKKMILKGGGSIDDEKNIMRNEFRVVRVKGITTDGRPVLEVDDRDFRKSEFIPVLGDWYLTPFKDDDLKDILSIGRYMLKSNEISDVNNLPEDNPVCKLVNGTWEKAN